MGLKDRLKLKVFRLRHFLIGNGGKRKSKHTMAKQPSWMVPISHGYHVVEDQSFRSGSSEESDFDSIVVQREQIEQTELWLFGVFDAQIGDAVTKYLQSHLFDSNPKESQVRRKSLETMKKAYLGARAKIRERQKYDNQTRVGSASVMVINGEKLVMANMGDYRAVVCRAGMAYQKGNKQQQTAKMHWSRRLFLVNKLAPSPKNAARVKHSKSPKLVVSAERIDSETEFIIIASTGVWEVMKNQEAVSLIRHIEDPQEAAQCLAMEALTRLSKSNISCLVIRFD